MKRSLLILICVLLITVFTLASCGGKGDKGDKPATHTHTYDTTKFVSDATSHWFAATCEHTNLRLNVKNHTDKDNDGLCDDCSYATCEHEYNEEEWATNETEHWHEPTCGCEVTKDNAAHEDGDKDGLCDVCGYATCEHELAKEWSKDDDGHWREYVCGCEIEPKVSEHDDNDKNGLCDTCEYVMCAHNPESAWSYDAYTHWHESDCGCTVRVDEAAHEYAPDGFTCTVCGKSCEHPPKEEWSYDENGHWHDASCGHEGYIHGEATHADKDNDGLCDICGYEDKTHQHTFELAYNKAQHYYLTSCWHLIAKDFENHFDETEDGYCDVCQAYLGDIADIIDSATSEDAAAKVNGGSWTEQQDTHLTSHTYNYYTDHFVYTSTNEYSSESYYLSSFLLDGVPTIMKVLVTDGTAKLISDADIAELQGQHISIMYKSIEAYGLESFIYAMYNFANDGTNVVYDYVEYYDPESGTVAFGFAYEDVNLSSDNSAQVFSVAFTISDGAIKTAAIQAKSYSEDDYRIDEENGLCLILGNTAAYAEYEYVFTQSIGERLEQDNPYSADEFFITDLTIYNSATGKEINNGDIVEIFVGKDNALIITLPEGDVERAENNNITVSCDSWDVIANSYSYPYRIYTVAKAGDYTITVSSYAGGSIVFTLRVNKIAPTSLSSAVVDGDGVKSKADSVESFVGVSTLIGAISKTQAGSEKVIASVTEGDASLVTLIADGENWLVFASEVGTYTITLTSALDPNVQTSITLVVVAAPTPEELLKGNYVIETEGGINITVKLYPAYEGALNGTVKIFYDDNAFQNRLVINEVATYVYADGVITLTHTEGDGLENIKALVITERYEVALIVLPYGSAMEQSVEYVLEKGPDDPNGTENAPFVVTESTDIEADLNADEYVYYTFVSSARGTLTLSVLDSFTDFEILYSLDGFSSAMNSIFVGTVVIDVSADATVYIKLGTMSGDAAKYGVSLTFEEAIVVAPTYESIAGTWEGKESNSSIYANKSWNVTLQLNADGTGTGTHGFTGIGSFKVTGITIDGMNVIINTDAESTNPTLYLVYDGEKLVLVEGKKGLMFGTTIELVQTTTAGDDDDEGDSGEVIDATWSSDVSAPTAITESGTYSVTVEAGKKGYFTVAHDVLGTESVTVSVTIEGGVLYESHPLRGDSAIPLTTISQTIDSATTFILAVGNEEGAAAVITVTITLS